MHIRPALLRFAAAATLWLAPAAASAEAPSVVVSIKPVHSLVAAVMDGIAVPDVIVEGGASPHVYTLRPSQARTLARSDLVVWVGPDYETFLSRPVEALADRAEVLALADLPGMTLYRARNGGAWERHDHADDHHAAGGGAAGDDHIPPGRLDGHLWLDTDNAGRIVAATAAALGRLDPDHAAAYDANAAATLARLDQLDAELHAMVEGAHDTPVIVFHDAYRYFEEAYGMNVAGSITVSPDRLPSARRLIEIRDTIRDRGATCVLAEPQFESGLVETVLEGTGARHGVLDPLGADLEADPELYFTLMRDLARSYTDCARIVG